MMAPSIRTRLWISYAILIMVVLCSLSCGIIFTLARSPLLYRTALEHIRITQSEVHVAINSMPPGKSIQALVIEVAARRNIRMLVTQNDGTVIFDTMAPIKSKTQLPDRIEISNAALSEDVVQFPVFRDSTGTAWFYALVPIPGGEYIAVAEIKPRLPVRIFFRDELFLPLIISGVGALILAFILSIIMRRWIALPLQRMSRSADKLAEGQLLTIPAEGPGEVQQLATALNEMGRKVHSSSQSQRDFVANVSHELKTPLTSIQGFAQSIIDGTTKGEDTTKQAAEIIYNEADRMNRLVLDLLTLAKLEGGTADLQRSEVDLRELLKKVAQKFKPQIKAAGINLEIEIDKLPRVVGDGDRLAQVFTNLIDNAVKFTPQGGMINISAKQVDGWIQVSVNDTGNGIEQEEITRIFERFYQVDKSRKGGDRRGVGLGLPIAKQIILAHNGRIEVKSSAGKGSEFIIQLPISMPTDTTLVSKKP